MAEMGRKGGKIGGKRRLKTMTAKERRDLAVKAAKDAGFFQEAFVGSFSRALFIA